MTKSCPRYQIYLLPASSTQKGALNSAFFRFEPISSDSSEGRFI
jgi:hypothetical protein